MRNILLVLSTLFSLYAHADQFSSLDDFKGIYEVEACEFPGISAGEKVEIKVFDNSDAVKKSKKEFVVAVNAMNGYQPMIDMNFVIRKAGQDRQVDILREKEEWGCSIGRSQVTFYPGHLEFESHSHYYNFCAIPSFKRSQSRKMLDLDGEKLIYSRFSKMSNKDIKCWMKKTRS